MAGLPAIHTVILHREGFEVDAEALIGRKWTEIRQAAWDVAEAPPDAFEQALTWYEHPAWEVRMCAVLILGTLASHDDRALPFLRDCCGQDPSWQVNEGLAMAFDRYCSGVGYETALPVINEWLKAPLPNLRRAVSEGLRPWTAKSRPYFAANPDEAMCLLGLLKDDDSRYVQESAGNALRDISRKHFGPVLTALQAWIAENPTVRSRRVIARFALKNAVKADSSLRSIYEQPATS